MGKRRHSDKDDEDYIASKIRKLERKLLKRGRRYRRRRECSENSSSTPNRDSSRSPINLADGSTESEIVDFFEEVENCDGGSVEPGASAPAVAPLTQQSVRNPVASTSTNCTSNIDPAQTSASSDQVIEPLAPELGSEILQILGDDPSITKTYGKDIQADLALRFQHIVTSGLTKELRKELMEKYLPPANCTLIDAPELNPEIRAAASEAVQKRDKGIELKQKQLASAIACLGEAMTLLITSEQRNVPVFKLLMDTSRLICDCQYVDSALRRNFVFYNLKKEMKDQLQKTKIDKFLFGQNLADTLKAAKAISKSCADLKSAPPPKQPTQPPRKNKPPPQKSLNWKVPPQSRRPKGTQRTKEPAQKIQHAGYSRTLSHPAPGRSRR